MIDSVSIWCRVNPRAPASLDLQDVREGISSKNGDPYTLGTLENMRVFMSPAIIRVTGSLAAFLHGSNLNTLNAIEMREAVLKLEESVHAHASEFAVSKIEIAQNFELSHPINHYLGYLESYGRMPTLRWDEGVRSSLTMKGKTKELAFYNKFYELSDKKKPIPIGLSPNLFRYEFRLLRAAAVALGFDSLTLQDLCADEVHLQAANAWVDHYFRIKRRKFEEPLQEGSIKQTKSMVNYLAAIGLARVGPASIGQLLRDCLPGVENRSIRSRANQKLRELQELYSANTPEAIRELDAHVQNAYEEITQGLASGDHSS